MVRSHLTEDGIMIVNMNMTSERENGINAYLQDTISSVFDSVYTVNVARSTNRELFASQNPEIAARFEQNAAAVSDPDLASMMKRVEIGLQRYEAGNLILTDDKAPVELLGMQTIDDMIRNELAYYKQKFLTEGISGIING